MIFQDGLDLNVPEQTLAAISELEKQFKTIQDECLAIDPVELASYSPQNPRNVKEDGLLKLYGLYYKFEEYFMNEGYRENFTGTQKIIQAIPNLCNAYFTLCEPGSAIYNHSDNTPFTFKVTLAIQIPEGCGFDINGKIYDIPVGEVLVWDSSMQHKVWNDSKDKHRIVLLLDVLKPDHEREEILNREKGSPRDQFEVINT